MHKHAIPARSELLAIALYFGFSSAVSQVILIRELLAVFRGNEFIIGIVFSAWFLGIFAGARLSGDAGPAVMARRVRTSALALPLALAISVYGCHIASALIPRVAGTFFSFATELVMSLVFVVPVSFIIGWFFPPLVSLFSHEAGDASGGRVYYIESAGSFIGGLAFSFILVTLLNPLQTMIILAVFALPISMRNRKPVLAAAFIALAAVFYLARPVEFGLFSRLWQANRTDRLVAYERTRYQAVALAADSERISVYGDGIFLYSLPDRYESRLIFHLIMALKGKKGGRMLLFGCGPGSVLYNLLQAGAGEVYYCESDPGLWNLVQPHVKKLYGIGGKSAGLKIIRRDVREYLLDSNERFDMIVNLASTPESIMLNRCFTREFYSLCTSRLNEGGIMIASVQGFSDYMGADLREFIASIYRAFTDEFPFSMITSGEIMYMAGAVSRGVIPDSPQVLIDRYLKDFKASGARYEKEIIDEFSATELSMFFERSQLDYFRESVARRLPAVHENSDLRPRGYWSHIMLSSLQEKSVFYRILKSALVVPFIAVLMLAAALADIMVRRGRRGAAGGLFIYIAGFAGISVVMVMILLHQIFFGIVYHRVALINACFMLGLAAGGFTFTSRKTLPPSAVFCLMALSLGLVCGYMMTGLDYFFWPSIVVFSFLNGGIYPVLFHGMSDTGFHERARLLDSMEHFGAISGSMVTVLFLVPFAGVGGTVLFNVALLFAASIMCFFFRV